MRKKLDVLLNWRIILLVVFIALSIIAINPQFGEDGVAIRNVERNSSAQLAGILNPGPGITPTARERIVEIDGEPIRDVEQYHDIISAYPVGRAMSITTDQNTYRVTVPNGSDIGLSVYEAPSTNLRLGLDLSGGTRVILQPKEQVSDEDLTLVIDNIKQRLNVYGLSDIIVRSATDLDGDKYIIVEIAGANEDEVQELLARQGKFDARIGNETVFRGGQDITYVCRSPQCSGIGWNQQGGACGQSGEGFACRFSFQITLSPEAAERQAYTTDKLEVIMDQSGGYLSQPLSLYLDNELVDELQISSDLKGRASTDILISGSGFGATQADAMEDAVANMKKLQTVLITGSLPVELDVVKSDSISPALGSEFISNAIMLGVLSILAVATVLSIRYREFIISIPIVVTMLSEIVMMLGFAAWVGWNLDLAAIAAIVIAIGSGVDDQIVIIDETLRGGVDKDRTRSWKERIGRAFFIVMAAYFTLAAAMIPLFFAGAGLLRGFALTTLVGITVGVLITRPAFAQIIEILMKKDDD
jgi:preprotein translocase subunit SecD